MAGFELVQDVVVFDVVERDDVLHVDVYGGAENVCASIRFTFGDPEVRRANATRLRRWQASGTPLSLVATDSCVTLLSERALFRRLEAAGAE
jgi:hypothetical protein